MAAVREARAPPERFWQPPPASSARLPNLRAEVARLKSPALRISRVAQLDAALLDDELEGILQTPVSAALDGVKVSPVRCPRET